MKTALTVGCGAGAGSVIVDTLLENSYKVTNIGSSNHPLSDNITITWSDLEIQNLHLIYTSQDPIDFVFFNHNSSSLDANAFASDHDTLQIWKLLKDWQHSHWLACQMPFLLLHLLKDRLTPDCKIGWMLSSTMRWDTPQVEQHPDYSSQKYFNFLAMKCFGTQYQTFGIVPDFSQADAKSLTKKIINDVCRTQVSSTVFEFGNYTND